MPVEWTEDLSVGVDTIDTQHKEMFRMINSLRSAMRGGTTRTEIEKTIAFLERYMAEHFSMEEDYMRRLGYPGILPHRAEHEAFAGDLAGYKRKWK